MIGRRCIDWVGRYRARAGGCILGAVAVSLAVLLVRRPDPPRVVVPAATVHALTSCLAASPGRLVVHLSGEVIAPGVYQLPVGARIDDALKAAGGPTGRGHPPAQSGRAAGGRSADRRAEAKVSPLHGKPGAACKPRARYG